MFQKYGQYVYDKLRQIDAKENLLLTTSDVKHSDFFSFLLDDVIRYVPERKSWYYYDGKVWSQDVGAIKTQELAKVVANMIREYSNSYSASDEQKAVAKRWQSYTYRKRIITDAQSPNTINLENFDSNPMLLNLNNGTFNLETGVLQEHNPNDLITKLAPVDYIYEATNERWDKFIMEIMSDDEEKARFLQKALGYSLTGSTYEECMFILYGATTRNGKGTLMESILNVLGDYGKSVKPETIAIANKSSNSHSEDIARLQGVRLANISEPPKNMLLNSALVKTLTGGDTINARYLHENSFEYKPQFKLFINTNYLPKIDDATVFMSNRVHIIPFERHFSPDEQEKTLKTQFSEDLAKSAILNWLVDGYWDSLNGLNPPEAVANATDNYRKESEPVYKFINEVLTPDSYGRLPVAEAHRQYTNWASGNNEPSLTKREFCSLARKYVEVKVAKVYGSSFQCIIGYSS